MYTCNFTCNYSSSMKLIIKIIRESVKVLIFASILSSFGGIGLESLNQKLVTILPFLILFPALNNLVGNFGIIFSSRFTTLLYMGKVKKNIFKSIEMRRLISSIFIIALVCTTYIAILANVIAFLKGFPFDLNVFLKILFSSVLMAVVLCIILIFISVIVGFHLLKKRKDPDNFLTPITTAIADLGCMLMISGMLYFFF